MLRAINGFGPTVSKHVTSTEFIGINSTFSQTIRWVRKPSWLPPAKSKLFKVRNRVQPPEHEAAESMRLSNNYRTYRASIRQFLMDYVESNRVQFDEEHVRQAEEEDFNICMSINDEWNQSVAKFREKRLQERLEARHLEVLSNISAKKERDAKVMERIENEVRKVKEEAKTFITAENIDQAIEEALSDTINYNHAIDIQGNRYESTLELKQQAMKQ